MRDILNDAAGLGRDPVLASQRGMKPALPKRFYEKAEAARGLSGHGVFLDGRPVRTPARKLLELPGQEAAALVAHEFAAQGDLIDPATMPVTRLANSIIDGVVDEVEAVREDILRFSGSDLVCYRAGSPQGLAERQAQHWDPLVEWMRDAHGANFILAEGVVHVAQPREALVAFARALAAFDEPVAIGALHSMTSLTGSAIIALAIASQAISAEAGWKAAQVDEDWNVEQWGEDAEASVRRNSRWSELQAAADLVAALPERGRRPNP